MSRHFDRLNRAHGILRQRQDSPVFLWFGTEMPCTHNTYARGTSIVVGGQELETDLVLWVRKNLFLVSSEQDPEIGGSASEISSSDNRPYPRSGLKLDFCGRTFKVQAVDDVTPNNVDGKLKLVCQSVTK